MGFKPERVRGVVAVGRESMTLRARHRECWPIVTSYWGTGWQAHACVATCALRLNHDVSERATARTVPQTVAPPRKMARCRAIFDTRFSRRRIPVHPRKSSSQMTHRSRHTTDTLPLRSLSASCLLMVLLSACASSGSISGGAAPTPVTVFTPNSGTASGTTGMQIVAGATGQSASVSASRDAVWARLPAAYESLGIPVSVKDDARFRIGNDQFKARRAINGVQMRTILDCGSDLNGEKAETYDIRLSIETTVAPGATAETSEITTTVSGLGRSPSFGNSEVTCGTKGELERRILRYVRVQFGLPAK
jgi:hypothetical protein